MRETALFGVFVAYVVAMCYLAIVGSVGDSTAAWGIVGGGLVAAICLEEPA